MSTSAFNPDEVLLKLDLKQKVALLTGSDFWHTTPLPEYGVPEIRLSDGSSGIRGTKWFEGVRGAAIPCGTALASSWDRGLLYEAGVLLGRECCAKGVSCWLGPTVNIQRGPLGGRGSESYSEDPYLTGSLASEIIKGCQSTGVVATIKHLVCNDQEDEKRALSAVVTSRALREIYLRPFQIAARDARPGALMTSYNKVNGTHVSESRDLLEDVVRAEWGADPLIMSDWLGTYSTTEAINAGLDLEMPGPTAVRGQIAELSVSSGKISMSTLDKRVLRVLKFIEEASRVRVSDTEDERDTPESRDINRRLAQNSIVLLKNDDNVLPIPPTVRRIALIGSHMKDAAAHATGATALEPYYTIHPFDAIKAKLSADVEVTYEVGVFTHKMLPVLDTRLLDNAHLLLYNEPPSVHNRQSVDDIVMTKTFFQLLDYVNTKLQSDTFYGTLEADLRPDVAGSWKFGLAVHGTAKLYLDEKLLVDNTTHQTPGTSFFKQGTVEEVGLRTLDASRTYKLRIEFGSAPTSTMGSSSKGSAGFGGGGVRLGACLDLTPEDALARAVSAAKQADYVVVCTGLNGEWEGEGFDRTSMDLPPSVDKLIYEVGRVCRNTIVVSRTGMPVTMPWAPDVPAVLQAWYGGNESGTAIADVLFGDFNPCGKMPLSWPRRLQENPTYLNFGPTMGRVLFGEDIFVGYRWYDQMHSDKLLWQFGHGLSYTTFAISSPTVIQHPAAAVDKRQTLAVAVKIRNTGSLAGAEVLQLYVSAPDSPTPRPIRELHGFEKVFLLPGQEKTVEIKVDRYAMSFWDEIEDKWCVEKGRYKITIRAGPDTQNESSRVECWVNIAQTFWWSGL